MSYSTLFQDCEINSNIPGTLLLIGDDESDRTILESIFSSTYAIQTAANGKEGLEQMQRHEQSLCAVLLDTMTPETDAVAILERLKTQKRTDEIPVFLIAATTDDEIIQKAYEFGVMDVISKPIVSYIVKRRINSVIELFSARKKLSCAVTSQEREILQQSQKIIELNMGMIESLSTAIEFRSGEAGEHVRRIHDITMLLLKNTPLGNGLSDEIIKHIALASIMHDLGKIAIPDAILNKPGRLTPDEFEIMKTHTIQGCAVLERIPQMHNHPSFRYAYDIARHHHERWDGRGYPDGLKGDDISIWAQIVSIADVYDALVSKRVYKEALNFEKTLSMIMNGECGVFNPKLLDAFQSVENSIRSLYVKQ